MGLKLFIFLATLLALLPGMVVFSIEMNTETFNGNTFCWVFFKIYFGKKKKRQLDGTSIQNKCFWLMVVDSKIHTQGLIEFYLYARFVIFMTSFKNTGT